MATKFSLKDPNPGIWFSFDDQDPESGSICIRVMNAAKLKEIRKLAIRDQVEYKHGQRFPFTKIDEDLMSDLTWDYCIVAWKKLEDDEGNPIECTKENKIKLMTENVGFQMFVQSCVTKVSEINEQYEVDREKNLLSMSSDNLKSQNVRRAKQ